jgi:hypothetical protein
MEGVHSLPLLVDAVDRVGIPSERTQKNLPVVSIHRQVLRADHLGVRSHPGSITPKAVEFAADAIQYRSPVARYS